MSERRWWTSGALPLVVVAGLWACGGQEPAKIGGPMPSFELPRLEGGTMSGDSLAGRPVVLNFWATWCQPCRKEFPVLNALHRDPRVEVVTVALDEEGAARVAPFVEREGLEYPVLLGNQEIFELFGGYTIPHTLVIDPDQTVVGVYRGPASEETLDRDLRRIGAFEEQVSGPA
jgi:thiol-disulfide isomerase/thioredoxin